MIAIDKDTLLTTQTKEHTTMNNQANTEMFNFSRAGQVMDKDLDSVGKNRKEKGFYKGLTIVGLVGDKLEDLAEIRYYHTASTNYACVWLHSSILGLYAHTGGKASGYGYNREEAALSVAISRLNIKTQHSFISDREFLEAFAEYLGVKVFTVVTINA